MGEPAECFMNPAELLEERLSDHTLKELQKNAELKQWRERLSVYLQMAQVAIPCVLRAGADGNVRCAEASKEILALQMKAKKK